MFLQEFFDHLAHGEFADLAIGNSETGTIVETAYPKIISHLNLGLNELYKKFILKKKECTIQQQAGVELYYLRSSYIATGGIFADDAYIVEEDTDGFDNDIVKILEAYDADGDEVPINNLKYPTTGIFTQAFDTLKMTPADPLKTVSIVYQAYHPRITLTETFNPETYQLYFPEYIEYALLCFIAAKLFKSKTTKTSEVTSPSYNSFLNQYDKACKEITELGLVEDTLFESKNFESKGWV